MFSVEKLKTLHQALCHYTCEKISIWGALNNFMNNPQTVYPQTVYPQTVYPQTIYPQTVYPPTIYHQSVYPQMVYP